MLTLPLFTIRRSKRLDALIALNRALLRRNLGHVDVLSGRYVVALGRDREA